MNEIESPSSICIAVTGSIAAYRTCDLIRSLTKQGFPVRVIMTKNAEKFVGRITFEALTNRRVLTSQWEQGMTHIEIKRDTAIFAIVPATADIIGKFSCGIADDLISTTYLSLQCPVLLAPSMNPAMYTSSAVQRNLARLKEDGVEILDPQNGETLCGDAGQGKMASVSYIEKALIEKFILTTEPETII